MRRYDVSDASDRLIIASPGTNGLPDFGALLAFLSLAVPALTWFLARSDDGSYPDGTLMILTTSAVMATAAVVFLVLQRAYRGSHPGKQLILDRRRDTVTRGGQRLCALTELACVELRLRPGGDDEIPRFEVALVVAGLRPPNAPRAASSAFEDGITVGESSDRGEMRTCAARIAAYAAVPLEEKGWW